MAKSFVIEPVFKELFPEAKIGIIVVRGLNNHYVEGKDYTELMAEAMESAKKHLNDPEFSQNPAVAVWREAFKKFKTKKGARASIEALLKRINNGNPVGAINPLVDLYNAVSMKYALPVGGEDVDTFVGNLRLTVADGGEGFLPLGAESDEPALAGEVVYKDDAGAVCRCFNWREASRTMLTENTANAMMCIEAIDPSRDDDFKAALSELSQLIEQHLGASTAVHILEETGSIEIE